MKKGVIFAGGVMPEKLNIQEIIGKDDFVICADSGYDNALSAGVVPEIVIGDMDSVNSRIDESVKKITLKCEKDETDTQVCIDYLAEKGFTSAVVIAALGGRYDHELANIMLLIYAEEKGVNLTLVDDNTEIFLVKGRRMVNGKKGDILSLVPVEQEAVGVTLSGLKYPLLEKNLKIGHTIGISNEFLADQAEINIKKGTLVAIKTKR